MANLKTFGISNTMLNQQRERFCLVKQALRQAVVVIGNRFPLPTTENVKKHNSKALITIWDKIIELELLPVNKKLYRAMKRISVGEYEHDDVYSDTMDLFLMELVVAYLEGKIEPPPAWVPSVSFAIPDVKDTIIRTMDMLVNRIDTSPEAMQKRRAWLDEAIRKTLEKHPEVR